MDLMLGNKRSEDRREMGGMLQSFLVQTLKVPERFNGNILV